MDDVEHHDNDDDDDDDGWKILKPDVILFETSIWGFDKPIPHPILDDPSKMMRIIANPVYDKLTISRAASIHKHSSTKSNRQSRQINRLKEKTMNLPSKSVDTEQTIITPLPDISQINNSQVQSNQLSNRQNLPPFSLPTALSSSSTSNQKSSRKSSSTSRSRIITARSTTQTIQAALADNDSNIKKPVADGIIRYVNSRHGFEVQRYSSANWLSTDVYTKDACQAHEKTFREMLDKKRHIERLSRSIYSSDYYSKRWHELLQSYKQGYLTHTQWAQQNYQLFCLRTLYTRAKKREQNDINLYNQDLRRARATSAFDEWKEIKSEENSTHPSRLTTARSHKTIEGTSGIANNSFSTAISKTTDENHTTLMDTNHRMSISTSGDSELQRIPIYQPIISSKNISSISSSTAPNILDKQRWSLQAMVKRVVGLNEPLRQPQPPKITDRKQSPVTITSTDSGFESAI
ncbi:unnamed protein product [Rotaria sordida]|uniref:Uncharacterized protein n=1 Tax=Rotaria sordida TaxID=392033 RepID=A0A814GSE2_9BILA|nr:unnamed protein product [Rotaria sordida]